MAGDDDEFLWEFLVESYENLDNIDARLVALESAQDPDSLAAIFRSMHTIKGTSGFFGFARVERLGHVAENLLGRIRDGELLLTEARATALLAATDGLRVLFAGIEATSNEPEHDITPVVERLQLLAVDTWVAEAETVEAVTVAPVDGPPAEQRKAARRTKRSANPPAAAGSERRTRTRRVVDAAAEIAAAELELVSVSISSPPSATATPPRHSAVGAKERIDKIENLTGALLTAAGVLSADDLALALALQGEGDRRQLGDILVDNGWVERAAIDSVLTLQRQLRGQAEPRQLEASPAEPRPGEARHGETRQGEPRQNAEDSTIRLDVSVLDELMNLVGELVLARNSLVRSISNIDDRSLLADSQRIDLVTSELQARVLRTRMRPIRSVWAKLPRLVRETSIVCGKNVTLELEGEDTELDKSVVEAIKDPMTHCVRNAIDHGLETPEQRVAAGKSPTGTLYLKASHDNGQVIIVVRDDGGGIDPARIRAKAIAKGLISEETAGRMPDREVLNLVFAPGFSTAEQVTEVSGRGVGMDVVRTNVERIGGTVSVSSVLGQGTTFTFAIPLTLAIIPALLVGIGSHRYAIPQTSLVELVRLTGDDATDLIEDMHGLAVYRLRGRLLPIVNAATVLQVDKAPERPGKKRLKIAVLQVEGGAFGLVVDEVHGTEEIVVKPIGAHYSALGCFAGATILGDGVVSLILDVPGIAHRADVANVHAVETPHHIVADEPPESVDMAQYVIVCHADGTRFAVPLDRVARLEKFDRSTVEEVSGSHVVQYRGRLLPLTSIGGWHDNATRPVVAAVLNTSLGEVGLVVDRVLDVATGERAAGGSITVADARATEVVDVEGLINSCRHLLEAVS